MSLETLNERFFVFTENEGAIEAVLWCKTKAEAKREAKQRKKKFPSEAKQVYVGELLVNGVRSE